MRLLDRGEVVEISGEKLIACNPDAPSAFVSHVISEYKSRTNGTCYGFALDGGIVVCDNGEHYTLQPRQYFAIHSPLRIFSQCVVVIELDQYKRLQMVGGPCEDRGRLKYIDGCMDSVLIAQPKLGDPCMNLLYFPTNIRQTMHTHPSLRCGMTVSGRGRAIFPNGEVPLQPGSVWFLETGGEHCFYTDDSELLVTAWHPDTDTGPTHDDHPMLNRTIVGGVSAREIESIRTK